VTRFSDAPHGFTNWAHSAYNAWASLHSWEQSMGQLHRSFGTEPPTEATEPGGGANTGTDTMDDANAWAGADTGADANAWAGADAGSDASAWTGADAGAFANTWGN
jgi:hypothetical protein